VPAPASRPGRDIARLTEQGHQVDNKRRGHLEMRRSRPPRMARLDKRNNALTQIIRKGDRHCKSPPSEVNHNSFGRGIPLILSERPML
jgi:hypothetical protein